MNRKIMAAALLAFGCGSGLDELDPDTHSFQVTNIDGPNGEHETRVVDLGFIPEHQSPPRQADGSWIGESEQALITVNGRYGIDSVAASDGPITRCPVNGYVGNPNIGPNHCAIAGTKNFRWGSGLDNSRDSWFGTNVPAAMANARARMAALHPGGNTSFVHSSTTNTSLMTAYVSFESATSPQCNRPGAIACEDHVNGPIILSTQGKRYRKSVPNQYGFWSRIYLNQSPDVDDDNPTKWTRNVLMHEIGHGMGFGHNNVQQTISGLGAVSSVMRGVTDQTDTDLPRLLPGTELFEATSYTLTE